MATTQTTTAAALATYTAAVLPHAALRNRTMVAATNTFNAAVAAGVPHDEAMAAYNAVRAAADAAYETATADATAAYMTARDRTPDRRPRCYSCGLPSLHLSDAGDCPACIGA